MNATDFSGKVVEWYQEHHRKLPWRHTRDPYKIWLSEIILQQTRVAQGLPYYRAFVKKYPTVTALAAAPEQDVLRLWQGLGYYTRARNLRACAKTVAAQFQGRFPKTSEDLRKLKGIGEYTAAAIASFAFRAPVAVVDGNVSRVMARIFGVREDIATPRGRKRVAELAQRILSLSRPDLHNQAMMEFGALQCTPRNPACNHCPFSRVCVARQEGLQSQLPVKRRPGRPDHRTFFYLVLRQGTRWLLKKRSDDDIWKGLYDFPLLESKTRLSLGDASKKIQGWLRPNQELTFSPVHRHVLSHQILRVRFVEAQWPAGAQLPPGPQFSGARFYTARQAEKLPKPVLVSKYLATRGVR